MSRRRIPLAMMTSFLMGCLASLGDPPGCPGAEPARLPEGPGLSAKYPGDAGLARDPAVLLAEDFENGALDALKKQWSDISNKDGKVLAFSKDVSPGSHGSRSIQMTATLAENTGGHLYTRLPRPVDKAFARFYVKFPKDSGYIHHFVHFGGYNPSTSWPQGGAGERPRGDDRITVGIEPYGHYGKFPAPGAWTFYTYWQEMKISGDHKYWGNALDGPHPTAIPLDRWQCIEIMLQLNSAPDKADGELALWIDGKLETYLKKGVPRGPWDGQGFKTATSGGEPFEGFRWRKSNDLKINFFWLLYYITENAPKQNNVSNPPAASRVWFDDIVVATEYIGPIKVASGQTGKEAATKPAPEGK